MKCGREISDGQVFCDSCLEVMAAYPVKPGTPIQLFSRPARIEKKHVHTVSAAELIRHQSRLIRWLYVAVIVLFITVCLIAGLYLNTLFQPTQPDIPLGRNYTTSATP